MVSPGVCGSHTGWDDRTSVSSLKDPCNSTVLNILSQARETLLSSLGIPLPILNALAIEIAGCLGLLSKELYHQVTTQYLEPSWQMLDTDHTELSPRVQERLSKKKLRSSSTA